MESVHRPALLMSTLFGVLVYLTTPKVLQFGLSGIVDALATSVFIVVVISLLLIGGRIGKFLSTIFIVIVILFNVGSWFYFEQQQTYLSVHTLYLLSELKTLIDVYANWKKALLAVGLLGVVVGISYALRSLETRISVATLSICCFLSCSYLGLQILYAEITVEERFSPHEATPVGHLLRSTGVFPFIKEDVEKQFELERTNLVKKLSENSAYVLPRRFSTANLNRLLGRQGVKDVDSSYPFFSANPAIKTDVQQRRVSEKLSVLIVVLESVRSSEMGLYGAEESATPFLDQLGRENIYADAFYATSNFTVKSEHAIHCSIFDYMMGAPVSKRENTINTMCLPSMLSSVGYQTLWFHGNDIEFYNREDYLPKLGFNENLALEVLNKEGDLPLLGWGIEDPTLFDIALEKLNALEDPFYAEILTVSNHMPFDYDWGIEFPSYLAAQSTMFERYRRGIYYTDRAVKHFYEQFKKSPIAENTILVVTGDHGIWTFPDHIDDGLRQNEQLFRVPLIMEIPNKSSSVVVGAHSHLDIAPTIVDVLGLEGANDFIGRSMLENEPPDDQRTLYLMTEQGLSYRFGDTACIPSLQCQNNINCYKAYEEEPAATQCFQVHPDDNLLHRTDRAVQIDSVVTPEQRALFDYAQMALEIGSAPQFNSRESVWASIEE